MNGIKMKTWERRVRWPGHETHLMDGNVPCGIKSVAYTTTLTAINGRLQRTPAGFSTSSYGALQGSIERLEPSMGPIVGQRYRYMSRLSGYVRRTVVI